MSPHVRLSFRAALAASLVSLAIAACGSSSSSSFVPPSIDRPVDVAFACYGGLRIVPLVDGKREATTAHPVTVSAQPVSSCDVRAQRRAADSKEPLPGGQEDLTGDGGARLEPVSYYGLILQSGPGTVAIAQFSAKRSAAFNGNDIAILDADPLTPGKNSISVGVRPVAIGTTPSGCHAVVANSGTCDLSVMDVNTALKLDGGAQVTRMEVKNAAGVPLGARPAAMAMAPGLPELGVGDQCMAPSGLAYVAYPGCNLVAAVDLATSTVVSGIKFNGGVPMLVDGNVTCNNECGGELASTAAWQPVTLDLVDDSRVYPPDKPAATRRLVIGARDSNALTLVELDPMTTLPVSVSKIDLDETTSGPLGVLDVALSPQIGMGNEADVSLPDEGTPQFQFAYAVATDGTIRVADTLSLKRECDTQLDPRYLLNETDVSTLSCLPFSDATRPRRAGAKGPGIEVPADGVASAVSILRVDLAVDEMRPIGPSRLNGYFGVVTSTTGATYIIDIDDNDKADVADPANPLAVDLATTLPHQLRDQVSQRSALAAATPETACSASGPGLDSSGAAAGGARLAGLVNRLTLPDVVANNKVGMLPNILQYQCEEVADDRRKQVAVSELAFTAPTDVRAKSYPDTRALAPTEDWRLVWEGTLSGDALNQDNDGPVVRLGTVKVEGGGLKVSDKSKPYCAAGVQPNDLVQLRGCDATSATNQCPLGFQCFVHPDAPSGLGACLPEKTGDNLLDVCRDYMISQRRYTVTEAKSGELVLRQRARVLHSTPLTGCVDDAQCQSLATYEARLATELHPFEDTTTTSRTYTCEAAADRGPLKRCVQTCTRDADCSSGSSCDEVSGRCLEGVVPPAECLTGIQRYDLRAGDAFTVLGSASGYLHSIRAAADGTCVPDPSPTANPLLIGRIPLTAPPCTGTGPTDLSPNPCSETVMHYIAKPSYVAGTCDLASPESVITSVTTNSIYFRNPGFSFHLVDTTYPGDAMCRGDRAGTLVDVPTPFTGFAITFRYTGGYTPLALRTSAVVPVRVVRGPQQSIWIVDEGDFQPETPGVPSTRGKVFRIEGASLSVVNTMQ